MAHCKNCGRELPASSSGTSVSCPYCGSMLPAAMDAPAGASVPVPSARRPRPPVTTVIVAINALVFVAMVLRGVSPAFPNTLQLLQWGADWGPLSLDGQPWRMLTSVFVHVGIIHIALNMWCLWNLGYLAERVFDRWTYILIYGFCGLFGNLASLWFHPTVVGAGASGAIFGIAGALIAAFYLGHLPLPKAAMRQTLRSLLTFAAYNLFFGAAIPGIDNSAHIGGLVSGLALGAAMSKYLTAPADARARRRFFVFAVAAVLFVVGMMYVKKKNGYVTQQGQPTAQRLHLRRTWPATLPSGYSAFSSCALVSFTMSAAWPRTE